MSFVSDSVKSAIKGKMSTGAWIPSIDLLNKAVNSVEHKLAQATQSSSTSAASASSARAAAAAPLAHASADSSIRSLQTQLISLLHKRSRCHMHLSEANAAARDCLRIRELDSSSISANCRLFSARMLNKQIEAAQRMAFNLFERTQISLPPGAVNPYSSLLLHLSQYARESSGVYDRDSMRSEIFDLMTITHTQEAVEAQRESGVTPCVRLSARADYVHPRIQVAVRMENKGFGVRVKPNCRGDGKDLAVISKGQLVMACKALVVFQHTDSVRHDYEAVQRRLDDVPQLAQQILRLASYGATEEERAAPLAEEGAIELNQRQIVPTAPVKFSVKHLKSVVTTNAFNDQCDEMATEQRIGGSALLFLPSFANHSCDSNLDTDIIGDHMFLNALRPIKEGEEATVTDFSRSNYLERRKFLKQNFHFHCMCTRCIAEEAKDNQADESPHEEALGVESPAAAAESRLPAFVSRLKTPRPAPKREVIEISSDEDEQMSEHDASIATSPSLIAGADRS